MKTLLFTIDYPPQVGGVANVYANLVKHWPLPDEMSVLDNANNSLINPSRKFLKWWPSFRLLKQQVKAQGIKHVIVGQILPLGTVTWLLAKKLGITYSVVLHGMDLPYALRSSRKRWLTIKILANAELVICTNSYVAKLAEAVVSKDKIKVVNPGYDHEPVVDLELAQSLKSKYDLADKKIVLSVGRLVARKGVDRLIDVWSEVNAFDSNALLVIIGGGSEEEALKARAAALPEKVRSKIIFAGKVSDSEKWAWLSLANVFAMPARDIDGDFEGFGIVYLEANLLGKPVLAGRSGGVPDAVVSDLNGLLVDPNNVKEIAQSLKLLISDTAYATKLGEQGRERARKFFNWPDRAKQFYDYVNSTDQK
ncbi:glycosyltransferase family 4 protein [Candidatus Falkowbacteria bacterium]|nr:glycosyltransferase family 4 protein [Candidatus Falkowbacteria bacterium]